jgi:hypothetical protein
MKTMSTLFHGASFQDTSPNLGAPKWFQRLTETLRTVSALLAVARVMRAHAGDDADTLRALYIAENRKHGLK